MEKDFLAAIIRQRMHDAIEIGQGEIRRRQGKQGVVPRVHAGAERQALSSRVIG